MASATLPLLVGTGVFLGVGMPLARWLAPQGVDPLAFALWPTAAAGLVLAALATARGASLLRWPLLRFGAIAGATGYALPMTLAFWLAGRAGAGYAAMAFTMPPLFTLGANLLLRRERWAWMRAAAIAVGLAGAVLLVAQSPSASQGDAWALVAVFAIPALIGGTNVYRSIHLPRGVPAPALGSLTLLSASALLLAAALATDAAEVPVSAPVLGGLGAQAAALVVGYVLYFELQKRAEPVVFSFMGYVTMLTGVGAGLLVLGEPARWTLLPGMALILLALRMVAR
ncbi:MAG TPA: DMT family transporter [Ramlibacter sp.]|nr:DMT family transporter [Ramlibacter sp.]